MLKKIFIFYVCMALPINAMQHLTKAFQRACADTRRYFNRTSLGLKAKTKPMHQSLKLFTTQIADLKSKGQYNQGFKLPKYCIGAVGAGIALSLLTKNSADESKASVQPRFVEEGLYVGKVNDTFYLAMERVTPRNIEMWRDYAGYQLWGIKRTYPNPYAKSLDGIAHFKWVIEDYRKGTICHLPGAINNTTELWIVYASNVPIKTKAKLAYNVDNPHIEMFVTVATTPDALITSHMGISRTYEAAQRLRQNPNLKQPDQSIHIHSFAAKVMKIRNPKKVYMLTTPVSAMRDILLKKMPRGSIFIGDNKYKADLLKAKENQHSLLYDPKQKSDESKAEYEARINIEAAERYKELHVDENIALLKSHPPRIEKGGARDNKELTLHCPCFKPSIVLSQHDVNYQWMFTDAYQSGKQYPYVLVNLDELSKASQLVSEA